MRKEHTDKRHSEQHTQGPGLEEIIRHGARQLIQKAVEAEFEVMLAEYDNVRLLDGRRAVVRNGHLPARQVLTSVGNVEVRVPRMRDRTGTGLKFNSALVPPWVRRSQRVSAALPWLYLKGISTGDMQPALSVLLGEDARGLSPNVISRLKAEWAAEHERWSRRDLSASQYVYWWADGVHTSLRGEHDERQCLLVIVGVRPDGIKELVAIGDGLRESKQSWLEVLRQLQDNGLRHGPKLAVGDGALGFWGALDELYPGTRRQRCWVHKTGNVLNALPKSVHAKAKSQLHEIWMAPTREEADKAFDRFVRHWQAKYPKASGKLIEDRQVLMAFYDFPAEHWVHLRTTNPIESTFATVRHRSSKTRNCVSRSSFLGLAFKLIQEAQKSWRRIRGYTMIKELMAGVVFQNGEAVVTEEATQQQQHAA